MFYIKKNYFFIFILLFSIINIILMFKNIKHFKKNKINFTKIPKNTVLYHCSFSNINKYNNKRRTWFSIDKYYFFKMKSCLKNFRRKCAYNEYVSISPSDLMNDISKWCEKCKPITLYKCILKKDIILLNVPYEMDINYFEVNHIQFNYFPNIMGLCTESNLLGERSSVYYFYFKSELFKNIKIEKLEYNDIQQNNKICGNCGLIHWTYLSIKSFLFYAYLDYIKNKFIYLEHYYYNSINNYIKKKKFNEIRISSYNIHNWKDAFYNKNTSNILDNIIKTNSDIICFQEFYNNEDINELYKIYENNYFYGNLAIFSKYKILNSYYKTLGRDHIYFLQRYLIVIKVQIGNRIINILNTHLDAFDNSELTRIKQLDVILKEINKINKKEYIILCGDFNSLKLSDYSKEYFNFLLQEPKYIPPPNNMKVIKTINKYFYDTKYLDIKKKKIKNEFTTWSLRRVDYIFINKNIKVRFDINKNTSSDHYLIYCDIDNLFN